jgi:hypothetical protein
LSEKPLKGLIILAFTCSCGTAAEYSTAKMDDEGEILMVFNKTGGLHLLDATDNFKYLIKIKVLNSLPVVEGHACN